MCLFSLHVDDKTPGDRASDCHSLSEPIGGFYRMSLEQLVVTRCRGCYFLRYYAGEAQRIMTPIAMPGPTGESNELRLVARGPWVCISPWNFPLAIFLGQVAAALATGNTVLALSLIHIRRCRRTPLCRSRWYAYH